MNLFAIDLRHLRYFVTLVEIGSFRAAASKLCITQPALTRQIQQLEEVLELSLLTRKPRGVEPTGAGRVLYDEARNVLMLFNQAMHRTQLAEQGRTGRLDIGIFGSAIFVTIPRIVKAFHDSFPEVEIALHTMDRAEQVQALHERRLTIGFDSCFNEEPGLRWKALQREKMHVVLHRTHPLAKRAKLTLADIAGGPLILYPRVPHPERGSTMLTFFHRRGLSPQNVQEVDDVTTAVALVSNGFGATLVAASACNLHFPDVVHRPVVASDRAMFDLCMVYREDNTSAMLQAFMRIACKLPAVTLAASSG